MRWPASVRETRGSHPAVQAVRSCACPHKGAAPGVRNTDAVPPRCWRAGVSGPPPERPGSGGRTEQASNTARGAPKVRRTCGKRRQDRRSHERRSCSGVARCRSPRVRNGPRRPARPRTGRGCTARNPRNSARERGRLRGCDGCSKLRFLKRRCLKIESEMATGHRSCVPDAVQRKRNAQRCSAEPGPRWKPARQFSNRPTPQAFEIDAVPVLHRTASLTLRAAMRPGHTGELCCDAPGTRERYVARTCAARRESAGANAPQCATRVSASTIRPMSLSIAHSRRPARLVSPSRTPRRPGRDSSSDSTQM